MAQLKLEDFAQAPPPPASPGGAPTVQTEEQRLQAYEEGYKAGWDDASKAEEDSQGRIAADFSQNLQELSFTFHEARSNILGAVRPLLQDMVEKVLPEICKATLGQHVLEQLHAKAEALASRPVEIVTAPENLAALEALMGAECSLPHSVIDEPSLGAGQVYLRFGDHEDKIDLDGVLSGIHDALAALDQEIEKEELNG